MKQGWIFAISFALFVIAVLCIVIGGEVEEGAKPGQGGIGPSRTSISAVFLSASLACFPAWVVGYVMYLVVHGASDDKVWGEHWGNVWFWAVAVTSGGGFFALIWNSAFHTKSIDTGFNASLKPFGRRWPRHWLSEGDHVLLWFIDISSPVDMRRTPSTVIEFTEASKDKTLISFKGNWMRQIRNPDAFNDTKNPDKALDVELEEAAREHIRNNTDDQLTGPGSDKTAMKVFINARLRELAKSYAVVDANDPNALEANITELLPPQEEVQAAGTRKAKRIDLDGYNERLAEFREKNHGLSPQEALAAFERLEGKRKTEQVVLDIQGLGNLPPTAQADLVRGLGGMGLRPTGGGKGGA